MTSGMEVSVHSTYKETSGVREWEPDRSVKAWERRESCRQEGDNHITPVLTERPSMSAHSSWTRCCKRHPKLTDPYIRTTSSATRFNALSPRFRDLLMLGGHYWQMAIGYVSLCHNLWSY